MREVVDRVFSGWIALEQGLQGCVLAHLLHLPRGGCKHALQAFKAEIQCGRFGAPDEGNKGVGKQPQDSQSWRRRFGASFTLTMPESSRNRPSSSRRR